MAALLNYKLSIHFYTLLNYIIICLS